MNAPAEIDPDRHQSTAGATRYTERLWVPVWWWLVVGGLAGSFWFAAQHGWPHLGGHLAGLATTLLCAAGLLVYGRLAIRVDQHSLRVGSARLPLTAVGSALPLSSAQARALRGPAADATARMFLRPYLPRGIRVEVTDPADPTPYWYVATRRPEALARALDDAVAAARTRD
ncbi:DUF3093 domain-containing protein [Actinopolymorpha sp. B11F2]|uniref:DUF3093 domain-containing protein n=1 Tax=Actinopolymorpha sp. B11F2 TaxID=3160862 RepID=UPI0032E518B4